MNHKLQVSTKFVLQRIQPAVCSDIRGPLDSIKTPTVVTK